MKKTFSQAPTEDKANKILQWIEEHKGINPASINLTGQHAFTEWLIVVSATSVRHAQSLSDGIAELCKENNYEFLSMEGKQSGQWILLDLNDIVINIFQESVRDLYGLEALWADTTA